MLLQNTDAAVLTISNLPRARTQVIGCHGDLVSVRRRATRAVAEARTRGGVVDEDAETPLPVRELRREVSNRRQGRDVELREKTRDEVLIG